MKQLALRYGLLAGLFVATLVLSTMPFFSDHSNMVWSMVLNYSAQVLAFSSIFIAVKTYRDRHLGGFIGFGPAFLLGLYISLIGSTLYVVAWAVDYNLFMPDFMDLYASGMLKKAASEGASAEKMAAMREEMEGFKVMYRNPLYFALFTYAEILPTGLILSLVAALAMWRRKAVRMA